jgi:hypothetical protein
MKRKAGPLRIDERLAAHVATRGSRRANITTASATACRQQIFRIMAAGPRTDRREHPHRDVGPDAGHAGGEYGDPRTTKWPAAGAD